MTVRSAAIHAAMLAAPARLRTPDFTALHAADLARLFALYDESFFGGWLGRTVLTTTSTPLTFRVSTRMTSAGGKTIRIRRRERGKEPTTRYQIAVGSRLLFMTFEDVDRPVMVCGLACENRLAALQRIMEHEIIHLAELLAWGRSSCATGRFRTLAQNIFGHAGTKHELVTPREHAAARHGIRLGQAVEFEYEGVRHVGTVNRIHRRATVLVESAQGARYTNGRRYLKFYIPLPLVRAVE